MRCSGPGDVVEGVLCPHHLLNLCVCHISVTIGAGPAAGGGERVSSLQLVLSVHPSVCAPSVQIGGPVRCHHRVEGWKMSSPKWLHSWAARAGVLWVLFALCVQRQKRISSLATYPHHDHQLVVGFWPLSTSRYRRNSHLGSGDQLSVPPLKAVVWG